MVTEQLTDFLNSGQNSLYPLQFGFTIKSATEMATCYFVERNHTRVRQWECCRGCILGSEKSIWYSKSQCSLKSPVLTFLCMWSNDGVLSNTEKIMHLSIRTLSFVYCCVDVLQGLIFRPLLFRLYVNNLPLVCPETQLYADDTVILYLHMVKTDMKWQSN